MKPLAELHAIDEPVILCDIDDTLTQEGRLTKEAFQALWQLHEQDIPVIPVTGRPAGWCELIARQWPVDGVIGENGGLYYRYNQRKMKRFYFKEPESDKSRLDTICQNILNQVPGSAVASDQFCRLFDLAIDFCEDVPPLSKEKVQNIVDIFQQHGATAKVSSIHVNGWFGDFSKLTTAKLYLAEEFGFNEDEMKKRCYFVGDSPNDEPMFSFFPNAIGVANVEDFSDQLRHPPKFVTEARCGKGFEQFVEHLLGP